ncbi:MAG: cupin domain-containing protein [Omnitrophica WOR_2 bacterium]
MNTWTDILNSKLYDIEVIDEFVELDKGDEFSSGIEIFNPDDLSAMKSNQGIVESSCVEGNMGGLLLIHIKAGETELHTHEYEHVGMVLNGSMSFIHEDGIVDLKSGDVYRILPDVPHGIYCKDHALIVQTCP